MRDVDLLIHPRWLVPVVPENTVREGWSVAIDDGRIAGVLPRADARSAFRPRRELTRDRHAMLPGLVNTHTHAAMTLLRGIADDKPLMDWLTNHIWPAESRWVGKRFVRDGTDLAIAEMLSGGITCFQDMYFFPETAADAAAGHGMRAGIGMIVLDSPSAWAADAGEYIHKGLVLRDKYQSHPLLSFAFAPHAPYTVGDASLSRIRELSDQLETGVHMHVHETRDEVADALAADGRRPLARLADLGLLSPGLQAVHMTDVDDHEFDQLATHGASVVHCPRSNLKLASGFCPVAKLADAGVNVALGTDGAASNNDLDMMGEMRTAALLAKAVAGDATALDAHATLRMATLNGARAMGLHASTGSVEAGKWADLCCLDLDHVATQPLYDVASQIVYAAGREQVTDTWVAGRHLYADGKLARMDTIELKQRATAWRDRIAGPVEGGAA